jgi:hypothetical protein
MAKTQRIYPKDLRNGDVIRLRTRNGYGRLTVAWVTEPQPGRNSFRLIEGPFVSDDSAEWRSEPQLCNSKVDVLRRGPR